MHRDHIGLVSADQDFERYQLTTKPQHPGWIASSFESERRAEKVGEIRRDSWEWIATGLGTPPWMQERVNRASASSLMSIFTSLDEQGQKTLLKLASALVA